MPKQVWSRDRFICTGNITEGVAKRTVRNSANEWLVETMIIKITAEREQVRSIVKDEIEAMMRLGAEVTKMCFNDKITNAKRLCITPTNMRKSYRHDYSDQNVKRMHWIFHELPVATHKDVLMKRMSHMDGVVEKVVHAMNIEWSERKDGESPKHKNCIEHVYSRILNEKRNTIVKTTKFEDPTRRVPYVKSPKTKEQAGNPINYKRGKRYFYWKSRAEGEFQVGDYSCYLVEGWTPP
jgi:hypothetical protein